MKQLIENKVEELLSGQFCLSKACLRGNQTVFTVKADAKKPYLKILAYKNCVAVCSSEELSGRLRELLQGLTGFENSLVFEKDGSTAARAVCPQEWIHTGVD